VTEDDNMTHAPAHPVDVLWRVWVLPEEGRWALASGSAMKDNRQARKVTLDAGRYARLRNGRLALDESLEPETLERAA
jgi:hypothetical protein